MRFAFVVIADERADSHTAVWACCGVRDRIGCVFSGTAMTIKRSLMFIGLLRPLIYNSKVIAEQLQIKRHGYCSSNWVVMKHPSIIEILIVSHSINNCSYN